MNIKKCTSLFLAFLLLISNVGMAFNVHYCGGEIASVSVKPIASKQVDKGCCAKKVEKEDSCCKDKVVNFQKKSDNTILKVFSIDSPYCLLINEAQFIAFSSIENCKSIQLTSYFCQANAPPLFKLYSQYIFYA